MEYQVLVNLLVPEIEEEYEVYIPVNKTIGEISINLCKMISDVSKAYPIRNNTCLCNKFSGIIYDKNQLVRDSDIRNGTSIVIF